MFLKNIRQILEPIRAFTTFYVDQRAVDANAWKWHIAHTDRYLSITEASEITLNLSKATFANSEI
jgi:hypothetical protein